VVDAERPSAGEPAKANSMTSDGSASDSDRRRLAVTLVHDLRNPLAALAGNLELLREELATVELTANAVGSLSDCDALVARALALVGNIVDADALERGVIVIRRSQVRVELEIDRAMATIDADVVARGLSVDRQLDTDLTADIDQRLLSRVLQCLLDNAVRYAPRGGRIAIRGARIGAEIELGVGNTGPALTLDERLQVFEREFRSAERHAGARRGRGLGMYFCRLVAEAHAGSITVMSRPELPVEFVLRLPA
jgi:two-component system, sensor histidine kinase and response regulator